MVPGVVASVAARSVTFALVAVNVTTSFPPTVAAAPDADIEVPAVNDPLFAAVKAVIAADVTAPNAVPAAIDWYADANSEAEIAALPAVQVSPFNVIVLVADKEVPAVKVAVAVSFLAAMLVGASPLVRF